ncbi:MAG TPA: GNAT family N-acetyltransferase [Thermoanaerobaculia bacterium]|nr:GNAT family N-acetyltransferase [Thermoanaerobaculia bacterium]
MHETISLRPETDDDLEFTARLYASTREEELRPVDWPDEQKVAFLRQQFDAQRLHYRQHYDFAEFWIIVDDGVPVGRLYIHRHGNDVRLMDIGLMPDHRGRGIGEMLVKRILDAAAAEGKSVSIHVEMFNPAMSLYQRLGFKQIDTYGVYHLMEWRPGVS